MQQIGRHLSACGLALSVSHAALAGGVAEHALLVIDPLQPDSLHVGNYYWHTRALTPNSVLYLDPDAASYPIWVSSVQPGLLGEMAQRSIRSHIDYVIVTPGNECYLSAPGIITDPCSPVTRFSLSGAISIAQLSSDVFGGLFHSTSLNRFYPPDAMPLWFDSRVAYNLGVPSTSSSAKKYFIGCMLGYTGPRGNTVAEVLAMIDRSAGVDGTHPTGTFVFMNNTADPARNVRQPNFAPVVASLGALGFTATQLNGSLPAGGATCLGVMSGFATADIDSAAFTLAPGAFADHLTSYAATFDIAYQTKISAWIRKGASGTAGTVEEPCNYTAKFPSPRVHEFYAQGMSLGESYFRSISGTPFQSLFVGDPLTRAHTFIPSVTVSDAPTKAVAGSISLSPIATATAPGASIGTLALMIDGVIVQTSNSPTTFSLDTTTLNDGWHDVRILAYDTSPIRSVGRWTGGIDVANTGRAALTHVTPDTGDLTTLFSIDTSTLGAAPDEVRVIHQGRVVASRRGEGEIGVHGRLLGSGPATIWAEAVFPDGTSVRSAPTTITISTDAPTVSFPAPVAFGYTRTVRADSPFVIELPSTFADELSSATFQVITPPGGSLITGGSGAARVLTPTTGACGYDELTFRVTTPSGTSNDATITILYADPSPCTSDLNHDCKVDVLDFLAFLDAFGSCEGAPGPCGVGGVDADFNHDMSVDVLDFLDFMDAFGSGCD